MRISPLQKRLLSLYESYVEPTINVTVHGVTKPYKEKLHVYVAQARFLLDKPAQIIQVVWQHHATKTALGPPSSQVQRSVVALPIDLRTGDPVPA
jgi:hypothetical protein